MTVNRPAAGSIRGGYALKALAAVEVLLAVLLTYVVLRSFWDTFFGPADPRDEEWSPVVLTVTAPIAASVWLTAVALLRNWPSRWILHVIPPAAILFVWLILVGLDRGLLPGPGPVFADGPSHDDFLAELVSSAETKMTPRFHYGYGFSFDKLAVLETFPKYTRKRGIQPRALIVVGPVDPMWTYHVITMLRETDGIRANALAMPHGRIVFKASSVVPEKDISEFLAFLESSALLTDRGQSAREINAAVPGTDEYRFNVLFVNFSTGKPVVRIGDIPRREQTQDSEALLERLNAFQRQLTQTYGN